MAADEPALSQEELDALLGGLGGGDKAAGGEDAPAGGGTVRIGKSGKVKPYDFRRPDRFSKDHIRTLEMVHESFARFLQASLSTYLRSQVDAKVASVQQLTYDEFINSLTNPTNINIFTMEPLKGNAVLEINFELIFAMIDRVLGGPGIVPKKMRELSAIEIPVVERIVVRALDNLREAWQKVAPIVPKLEEIGSNPHFVQIAAPSEIVALVALDLKVREQTGRLHLCLPYVLLEPIVARLLAKEWISSGQKGGPTSDSMVNLKRGLGDTTLKVTAVLGRASATLHEIMALKPGDIVRLERNIREDLTLEIEGREKFKIKPAIVNKRKGAVITEVIKPPEDTF